MYEEEIRVAFMENATKIIAVEGFEKIELKRLFDDCELTEEKFFYFFKDKDDLIIQTFSWLDKQLYTKITSMLPIMINKQIEAKVKLRELFDVCWSFILGNENRARTFIQYYYSPHFKEYSYDLHTEMYSGFVERMTPYFREKANVWMLMNHILNVMLDFAVQVFNGESENNEETAERVFMLLYTSIVPYLN